MDQEEEHPCEGCAVARAAGSAVDEVASQGGGRRDARRPTWHAGTNDESAPAPLLPRVAAAFAVGMATASVMAPIAEVPALTDAHGAWRYALYAIALLTALQAWRLRHGGAGIACGDPARHWTTVAWLCVGFLWTEAQRSVVDTTHGVHLEPEELRVIRSRDGPSFSVPTQGTLVRLVGTTHGNCRNGPPATDLVNSGRLDQATREVDLEDVVVTGEAAYAVAGTIVLRVESSSWDCRDGTRIAARGWLHAPGPRRNPRPDDGAPERSPLLAAALGDRRRAQGWLMVPDQRLIQSAVAGADGVQELPAGRFDLARRQARAVVLSALSSAQADWSTIPGRSDAWHLLTTMLLGESAEDRSPPDASSPAGGEVDTEEAFAAAGLTHLIAISGFNLAVLAGAVHWCGSVARVGRRFTAVAAVLLVTAYALIVEPQASVTRSAVCAIGAGLAVVFARRWRGGSVLALAALLILITDPAELLRPGFQLTFAAVLALRSLAPMLHDRWYGDRAPPETLAELLPHALRSLIATTVAVWLVTTPIAVWHFGRIAPFAIPLSVVAIPLGSLVLVAGYAAAGIALLSPTVAAPFVALASLLASALLGLARIGSGAADSLGSLWSGALAAVSDAASLRSAFDPSFFGHAWPWCVLSTIMAIIWCRAQERRQARRAGALLAFVWTVPLVAAVAHHAARPRITLRATMLAVGDGSNFFVESGNAVVVVDAGSSTSRRVGRDVLLPALAEAGIREVDAVIITHPDLDHFSAVPSLIESVPVGEVILTDYFLWAAEREPDGLPAELVRRVRLAGVPISVASRGTERRFGEATWTWLHPPAGFRPERDNDSSQVICVEAAARRGPSTPDDDTNEPHSTRAPRILFTGDLELRGAQALMRNAIAECDVCELPHHGAWQPGIAPLLRRLSPGLVIQSTASRRFERDRWHEVWGDFGSPTRAVTCRDGAVRIDVQTTGDLLLSRWDGRTWRSFGRSRRAGESGVDAAPGATPTLPGIRSGHPPGGRSTADVSAPQPAASLVAGREAPAETRRRLEQVHARPP